MSHLAKVKQTLFSGIDVFSRRLDEKKRLYDKLWLLVEADSSNDPIYRITDPALFQEVMSCFGAALDGKTSVFDLQTVYEAGVHKASGALMICNKGATLFSLSPKTSTPHLVRHLGFCVYMPGLGIEMVNVGLVGDVYHDRVVLRSESACTPSFLFGSQRCNCAHQWMSTQELAASFNPCTLPELQAGKVFEQWVQQQLTYVDQQHSFAKSGPGFILMHLDTQNGMGSGFTEGEFAFDLFSRASLRHRGEYSSEQIHQTTMAGGFEAIGLRPDPRQGNECVGYKTTAIVLDYLGVSKNLVLLSNNPFKIRALEERGYQLKTVRLIGEVNLAGAQEALERGMEFHHIGMNGACISFDEDFRRLKKEVTEALYG